MDLSRRTVLLALGGLLLFIALIAVIKTRGNSGKKGKWTQKQKNNILNEILSGMKKAQMSCIKGEGDNLKTFVIQLTEQIAAKYDYTQAKREFSKNGKSSEIDKMTMDLLVQHCDGYPGSWTQKQKEDYFNKIMSDNRAVYCSTDPDVNSKYVGCVVELYSRSIPYNLANSLEAPPEIASAAQEILK